MGRTPWVAVGLAALVARARAQTFTTDLKGLGGTPIGLTPLNTPGTSLMAVNWLTADPEVRAQLGLVRRRC